VELRTIAAYAILTLLVLSLSAVFLYLTRERRAEKRWFNRERKRRMALRNAGADAAANRS
jgi:hypothetical protein